MNILRIIEVINNIKTGDAMEYLCSAGMGYLLGSISPSYIISKIKKIDIREGGTKNLGASNTFMHFGRFWGIFVMLFDILKAYFAVKISEAIWAGKLLVGLVAGSAAVLGHNHPFYLKFKGGKGLASFAGFALAASPLLFIILLVLCVAIAFILNFGCTLSLSASVLFPILAGVYFGSVPAFIICAVAGASVFVKHMENIGRILSGEETKLTSFIGKYLFGVRHGDK